MSKSDSMLHFERNTRRIFVKDGLIDMMLGIFLVLMAIWIVNRYMIFHLVWLIAAQVIIEAIRRKIIYPRVGYVKFRHETLLPFVLVFASIAIIAALAGIIAVIAGLLQSPLRHNTQHIIILATVIYVPIILGAFAYHHKAYRWIAYGILIALLMLFGMLTNSATIPYLFTITGVIITAAGAMIFIRFLRDHQPAGKEVSHDPAD
ncbi:MAG: hypothetical protein JSW49_04905 [candidate division WOR-3 bacterium]|nr:MAG: hypothetical protein JSW49_04905 [candidate division WOR-3 bacterium]